MTKKSIAKRLEEIRQEIDLINAEQSLKSMKGTESRSQSVTVGTAFGGVTELSMRGNDGRTLWCLMQPVEVMELIHQLSANIGCHISVQPRNDFASWRNWKNEVALGFSPRNEPMHPPLTGAASENPDYQTALLARSDSNEQTVATQETVGRKRTKRAAAAA